jgi:hypothetical protein
MPQAMTCVQEARRLAVGSSTPTIRAWLAAIEAETQASVFNSTACLKALDEAECVDDQQQSLEDSYLIHFDRSLLGGYQGVCFRKLYRPDEARSRMYLGKAEEVLLGALSSLDPALIQRRPTLLTDLADTHLRKGEIEEACGRATEAMEIASQIKLHKVVQRLFTIREGMEPWQATMYVKDLDTHLAPLAIFSRKYILST